MSVNARQLPMGIERRLKELKGGCEEEKEFQYSKPPASWRGEKPLWGGGKSTLGSVPTAPLGAVPRDARGSPSMTRARDKGAPGQVTQLSLEWPRRVSRSPGRPPEWGWGERR